MLQHLFIGALAAILWVATAEAQSPQRRPERVASLNLCTDQLLLALADRSQIASLSPLAKDSSISFLAADVGTIPVNRGSGEALLFAETDLVLAASYDSRARRSLLQRHGVEVMVLDPWQSLEEGRAQIRRLAGRLGHPERGESLIARIEAAMAEAKDIVPDGLSVLIYHRRGWVPSVQSLTSELLAHMGFELHQERLGAAGGGVVRLETIVAAPPDFALMDDLAGDSVDQGSALLAHPALAEAVPAERRLVLPSNLTICGGPPTPAAIRSLAEEVRRALR
jgi:iron complex transport system substrate-binding protein